MSAHWIMGLPLCGITYILSAVGCATSAFCRKTENILWPLSALTFSVGILNLCCEERLTISHLPFVGIALVLMVVFLSAYRWLCLRLIERTGLRSGISSEIYSNLPIVYAGLTALAVLSPSFTKRENPPLVLYTFIVLVCAIHVPSLKFGKSRIDKYVADSGITLSKESTDFSSGFFKIAIAAMGIPLLVSLVAQGVLLGDYRLSTINAAMVTEIFSLLWIFRRGNSSKVSYSVMAP
jgi:hypothetical protein